MPASQGTLSSFPRPGALIAGCALLGVVIPCAAVLGWNRRRESRSPVSNAGAAAAGLRPIRVVPRPWPSAVIDAADAERAVDRLRMDGPDELGEVLHAMRLFGPSEPVHWGPQHRRATLLDAVLDPEVGAGLLGAPALIETRDGVRCRVSHRRNPWKQGDRQTHEDQLLAVLAEAGVPLGQPLSTASGRHTVRRVLDDALARFDLKQGEVEWSALAFALYLPPRTRWADKFGRVCTFDDIAEEMMGRELEGRACAGTHVLYSLAVIFRVDRDRPILSERVRERLRSYLADMASVALRRQAAEGPWGPGWHSDLKADPARDGSASADVLVTGHLIEWLRILPDGLGPPDGRLVPAVRWLERRLSAATDREIVAHYCPYSHAGRVVLTASKHGTTDEASRGGSSANTSPPSRAGPRAARVSFQGGFPGLGSGGR